MIKFTQSEINQLSTWFQVALPPEGVLNVLSFIPNTEHADIIDRVTVTDHTASVQAAVDEWISRDSGDLLFPPGLYNLGAVTINADFANTKRTNWRIIGMPGATIRPTVAPCLTIQNVNGAVSRNSEGLLIEGLYFELAQDLFWSAGVIKLQHSREWRISNCTLIGGTDYVDTNLIYSGMLLQLDTAYNGLIENCSNRGRYTMLLEMDGIAGPAAQTDTVVLDRCGSSSMFPVSLRHGSDLHGINIRSWKHVIQHVDDKFMHDEMELSAGFAAGATSITVQALTADTDLTGVGTTLAVDDPILIGEYYNDGAGTDIVNYEINKVVSVAGATIGLAAPLRYQHYTGDKVIHGGASFILSPSCRTVSLDSPHFEGLMCGVLSIGADNLMIRNAYSSARMLIRCTGDAASIATTVESGVMAGANSMNTIIRVDEAARTWGSGNFYTRGPFTLSGAYTAFFLPFDPAGGGSRRVHQITPASADAGVSWPDQVERIRYNRDSTIPYRLRYHTNGAVVWEERANGDLYTNGTTIYTGNSANRGIMWGDGTPEGVISATKGMVYVQRDDANGWTFWIKSTATGGAPSNTGWRYALLAPASTATTANEQQSGSLFLNGGLRVKRTTVSDANYNILTTDLIVAMTTLTAPRTITLPVAATAAIGRVYIVKDESGNAGTSTITLDGNGTELIDGAGNQTITTAYGVLRVYTNAVAWFTC